MPEAGHASGSGERPPARSCKERPASPPSPRSRAARILDRIPSGSPRRPLEPRRAAPWLLRTASWAAAAIAFLCLAPAAALVAAGVPAWPVARLGSAAAVLLLIAIISRVLAAATRPLPLDLAPYEEA